MKRSTRILGITLLALTGLILMGMISTRIYLDRKIGNEYRDYERVIPGESRTLIFEMKDFDSLNLEGGWEVEISQGPEYSVEVEAPDNLLDRVEALQTGRTLKVRNDFKSAMDGGSFILRLTMPEFSSLVIAGGTDLSFTGFSGDELSITLAGAGRIRAFSSGYTNLNLVCAGAGQMDMTGLASINANVTLSGAGEVLLNMTGGTLSGVLSGMGSVEYDGYVKEESIRITGLGSVSRR